MSTHQQRQQKRAAPAVEDDGPLVEVMEMTIVYRVPVYAANVGDALDKLREDGYAFLKEPTTIRKMHERSLSDESSRQRR